MSRLPGQFPYPKQTGQGGQQPAPGAHTHVLKDLLPSGGTDGQVLTKDSTKPEVVKWSTVSGGGGGSTPTFANLEKYRVD